jgi:hypothetical protein
MRFHTERARRLDQLFSGCRRCLARDPAAGELARELTALLGFFRTLPPELPDNLAAVRWALDLFNVPRPAPASPGFTVVDAFELSLVVRKHCDAGRAPGAPFADHVREVLLAAMQSVWARVEDVDDTGRRLTERVLPALQPAAGDGRPLRPVFAFAAELTRFVIAGLPEGESADLGRLLRLLGWALDTAGHDCLLALPDPALYPLRDLVFYDWSWGVPAGEKQYHPWQDAKPRPEPARSEEAGFHWRNDKGRTLGFPLRRDGRVPLRCFNADLLLNLAAWQARCERSRPAAAGPFAALCDGLFGPLQPDKPAEAVAVEPHANYGTEERLAGCEAWQATKAHWLCRKDVLREGRALRFWAANNAFLSYLFRDWGWLPPPEAEPAPAPTEQLELRWPVVPTLTRLASLGARDGRRPTLQATQEADLARFVRSLGPAAELDRLGIETDDATAANLPDAGQCALEWLTVGAPQCGKTYLDMAVLYRLGRPRQTASNLQVKRSAGGESFYRELRGQWERPDPGPIKTETEQLADLDVFAGNLPGWTNLRVVINDTPGGEYQITSLVKDVKVTDKFADVVAPRLKSAGVICLALKAGSLLDEVPDDVLGRVGDEVLLLEKCDEGEETASPGRPVGLILTQVDQLGLDEPLEGAALLFEHVPGGGKEEVKAVLERGARRPDRNRLVQQQFLLHRLWERGSRLLSQMIRGPVLQQPADRAAAVFLTCGLYGRLPKEGDQRLTGAEAVAVWVADYFARRWAATLTHLGGGCATLLAEVERNMTASYRQLRKYTRLLTRPWPFARLASKRAAYEQLQRQLGEAFGDVKLRSVPKEGDRPADSPLFYAGEAPQINRWLSNYRTHLSLVRDAVAGARRVRAGAPASRGP